MTAGSTGLRQRHVSAKPDHDTASPSLSDTTTQQAHSPATALWLESRRQADGSFRPHGENRPFTFKNVWIARRLIRLVGPRFVLLFLKGQEWRVGAFFAWTLVKGLIPATKIWASIRILDVVQASFDAKGVDKEEVIRVALISAILPFGEDLFSTVANDNREIIRTHVNHILERAYLATQLSLSIPALSSPYITSLVHEAGIFAGHEARVTGNMVRSSGGPFDCLSSIFSLLNILVTVISKVYLLLRTLSSGSSLNLSSILLLALAIAPSFLRIVGDLFRPRQTYAVRLSGIRNRQSKRDITNMGKVGPHKQEIILFGLKDWVLGKWDMISTHNEAERLGQQRENRAFEIGLKLVEDNVQTSFYVLLALRILPTNLSLGSIRLYQQITQSLLQSLRSISETCSNTYQTVFLLAAFTEAIDLPNHPEVLSPSAYRHAELLDYDDHRVEGGMGLTVTDLSFKYPGTDKDVLRNINLTIKSGTTLAIVGFNGGGKTTLVKALMGLYDHHGTILLNGYPIESFDPSTVHRRTSCLFQDFCKYSFTLRENVGMGNVTHMEDIEWIQQAIERGGAEKVLEKVGMEGQLSRTGIPDPTGADGEIQFKDKEAERMKRIYGQKHGSGLAGIVPKLLRKRVATRPPESPTELASNPGTPTTSAAPAAPPRSQPPNVADVMTDAEGNKASLSGGQWQRVALSRAFMRAGEADLVVFDEPSASLDPRAEAQLFDRIHALSHQNGRRCTTIYISHRFSTVKRADQIAVVEDGTIVECGPHAELMARNGRYAELYNLQKAGFED